LHDAVSTTPADAAHDNHVVSVIREGYRIGDEVLRPASVVVLVVSTTTRTLSANDI